MRTVVLLASILVVGAALSGCFGSEEDPKTAAVDPPTGTTGTGSTGTVTVPEGGLKVLASLTPAITTDAPAWVKSGTAINVSGAASSKASGAVTYTWSVGPLPGTVEVKSAALDTKAIQPGKESKLKFEAAGVYAMHCHPHPNMVHNVTVIQGYAGPAEAVVYITDGAEVGQYRFVPESVVIPAGGSVVYRNVGTQMHTSTQSSQEPALKASSLKSAGGELVVEGEGWQRVRLVVQDAEGRIGAVEHRIYVTSELPAFTTKEVAGQFKVGAPSPVPENVVEIKTESFKLEHSGKLYLNFTATDAASGAGAPVNAALVEIHLKEQGATQDTLTVDPANEGSADAIVGAKTYTLTIKPTQGVLVDYKVVINVEYDLVPPEPAMGGAGGGHDDSGGGGHAHH